MLPGSDGCLSDTTTENGEAIYPFWSYRKQSGPGSPVQWLPVVCDPVRQLSASSFIIDSPFSHLAAFLGHFSRIFSALCQPTRAVWYALRGDFPRGPDAD